MGQNRNKSNKRVKLRRGKREERKQEMGRDRGDEKTLDLLFFPWNPPPCNRLVREMQFLPIDWSAPLPWAGRSSLSKPRRRCRSLEHNPYRQQLQELIIIHISLYQHF